MKNDYTVYRLSKAEAIRCLGESLAICLFLNYLFYKAWWAFLLLSPFPILYLKWKRRQKAAERRRKLNYGFRDALQSLGVALQAGYSVESSIAVCSRELERLYPPEADIVTEFRDMEKQLRVSIPVEKLFMDLARRSGLEDIQNFASVFAAAKRSGGDMLGILQKTVHVLGDKIDVKKEIEATVAAKKSEQAIMSLMPFGIILYMQITSPGFLQVLYGNVFGVFTMSICLGVYFFAYWLGRHIVEIEV